MTLCPLCSCVTYGPCSLIVLVSIFVSAHGKTKKKFVAPPRFISDLLHKRQRTMRPKPRERFNAKARKSQVGGSTHKGKKSMRERQLIEADSNAQIIDDATREALVEQDRQRRQLLREGGNDETMKISSKKRKRLDKFIQAKLRKEEKVRILEKLAKSSTEISDRTELVSAATLGTGRVTKEAERVKKLLDQTDPSKKSHSAAFTVQEDDEDDDLDAKNDKSHFELDREHVLPDMDDRQHRILEALKNFEPKEGTEPSKSTTPVVVGSALAKDADNMPIKPVMRKRQRKGKVNDRSNLSIVARVMRGKHEVEETNDTDSSFDTEDDDINSHQEEPEEDEDPDIPMNVFDVDKLIAERRAQEQDNESVATDDLESEEADTDADEETVLLEAMRLRGMLPSKDGTLPNCFLSQAQDSKCLKGNSIDLHETTSSMDEASEEVSDEDEESGEGDDSLDSDEDNAEAFSLADLHGRPSKRRGIGESSRSLGFKEWANEALQLTRPKGENSDERPLEPVGGFVDRVRDLGPQDGKIRGPLGQDMSNVRSSFAQQYFDEEALFRSFGEKAPLRHVVVDRPSDLQEARMQLPVVREEDTVLRTVFENPVTVLCGETGSGKTTQVPQFLYEAGFGSKGSGT